MPQLKHNVVFVLYVATVHFIKHLWPHVCLCVCPPQVMSAGRNADGRELQIPLQQCALSLAALSLAQRPWPSDHVAGFLPQHGGFRDHFVATPEPKYCCESCKLVLCNPRQTECGHRFCETCISEQLRWGEEIWYSSWVWELMGMFRKLQLRNYRNSCQCVWYVSCLSGKIGLSFNDHVMIMWWWLRNNEVIGH